MPRNLYVNLPVQNLDRTVDFFAARALGDRRRRQSALERFPLGIEHRLKARADQHARSAARR